MTSVNDDRHALTEPTESGLNKGPSPLAALARWHALVALALIVALEFACFGPILNKVGFYLDDWITLNLIQSGPHSLFSAFHQYLLSDPRVIVRPVEAFFYVIEFFAFGLKPFGYHLVNAVLEIASAFFLYLALFDLTRKPALSLVAGLILIIYPNHDVTHYWATCSSENVSLALSMASLVLTTKAANQAKLSYYYGAIICFLLSIFCYETFLPLVLLNIFFAYIIFRRQAPVAAFRRAALLCAPFILSVVALLIYSRLIAPMLGPAQVHAVHFNIQNIVSAVVEGVRINCPPYSVQFFSNLAAQSFEYASGKTLWTTLAVVCVIVTGAFFVLSNSPEDQDQPVVLLPLGLVTVVFSYTIFGLNPEYVPTFQTILNRINEGAAVGIAIAAAGLVALIFKILGARALNRAVQTSVIAAVILPVIALSLLANRGYSRPWILSWQTQKVIQDSLKDNASRFHPGDSIILANCPRYVMWSPLFDGVWDFQPMLQLTLKTRDIKGGVVSERMEIQNNQLKDISRGVVCNTYDFERLFIIIPPRGEIIPVHSADQFISVIERRGFGFGLERSVIGKWRSQLR
jgi:hypothetical protein